MTLTILSAIFILDRWEKVNSYKKRISQVFSDPIIRSFMFNRNGPKNRNIFTAAEKISKEREIFDFDQLEHEYFSSGVHSADSTGKFYHFHTLILSRFSTWRVCPREQAKSECDWLMMSSCLSPANQVASFSVRANKFAKWKTGFRISISKISIL